MLPRSGGRLPPDLTDLGTLARRPGRSLGSTSQHCQSQGHHLNTEATMATTERHSLISTHDSCNKRSAASADGLVPELPCRRLARNADHGCALLDNP
jgi:hypothetical protein